MYLSTAVLVAAICGPTVCATPLPSANESLTEGPGAVVKRQSVDRVCGGKWFFLIYHETRKKRTPALTDKNA